MYEIYRTIWCKQHKLSKESMFIFEAYLFLSIILSLFIVFIFSFLSFRQSLLLLWVISYVCVAYNSPIISHKIKNLPKCFRVDGNIFWKYLLLYVLTVNEMIFAVVLTNLGFLFASFFGIIDIQLFFLSLVLCLGLFGLVFVKKNEKTILWQILVFLCLPLCSAELWNNKPGLFALIAPIALIASAFLIFAFKESRFLIYHKRKKLRREDLNYLGVILSFLRAQSVANSIKILILLLYISIAKVFSFGGSFFALISFMLTFELSIYGQLRLQAGDLTGRILFLAASPERIKRIFYGELWFEFFAWIVGLFLIVTLYFNGISNWLKAIVCVTWLLVLLFYGLYLEKEVVIKRGKRPNFFEEYVAVIICILLVMI